MPKGHTYILLCSDDSYYTGSTKNLALRLEQHNQGEGSNYTKRRLPVKLVYYETYEHVALAFNREKQIQGWTRKKKEALILGDLTNLEFLAECQNTSHPENKSGNQNDIHTKALILYIFIVWNAIAIFFML